MVELGNDAGVRTSALITGMDTPLGLTAGNALEVRESVEVLAGGGPSDVVELTLVLAREMLSAAGIDGIDPADKTGRRHGNGPVARDDRRTRWGPTRDAAGGPAQRRRHRGPRRRTDPTRRHGGGHRGPGNWEPDANGRAKPFRPVPASRCMQSLATWSVPGRTLMTLHTDTPERFDAARRSLGGGWSIGGRFRHRFRDRCSSSELWVIRVSVGE